MKTIIWYATLALNILGWSIQGHYRLGSNSIAECTSSDIGWAGGHAGGTVMFAKNGWHDQVAVTVGTFA